MWGDTYLGIERAHFLRIGSWGVASVVLGTLLLAVFAARRERSVLVRAFAMQTAIWGAVCLSLALVAMSRLRLPDYAAATRFDRFLWWSLGIDTGGAAVGMA